MSVSTQVVFNATASTYDADRALLIPCYDTLYRRAINLIPSRANRILDLGAGTGLLSAWVRQRFPNAYLHLIDNSEPMLDKARERFSRDQETVFQLGDYTNAPWGSNYDAIVSALSIHHLDDATKRSLFARIFTALRPGGTFVNAEQVAGPTPALDELYKKLWLEQVREAGATPDQIADSLYRQQDDRCASVEDQLDWLRASGFSNVDCWFKDNRFAVFAGERPASV